MLTLSYVDKLQRANADDLAFYPLTTLGDALESGHVIHCEDNGEPAGYLWFGALRGAVAPSSKPIDLKSYNQLKRDGEAMPSRFSRSHYG